MSADPPQPAAVPFTGGERRLIATAWVTYAAFYLGRLNLSPALPAIAADLEIDLGAVGVLGTVFFWCYAAGQLINGQVGNYLRPQRLVLAGLLVIALTNLLFAMQTALLPLAVMWGLNGLAQAAGWGPLLRVLSTHLSTAQTRRISLLFSLCFQVGTAVAWGLAGLLLVLGDWRTAFWVPGLLLLGAALGWKLSGYDARTDPASAPPPFRLADIYGEVTRLLPLLLAAACTGFVYIGFLLWLPTFIQSWDFVPAASTRAITAVVPLIGIPGMLGAGRLLARLGDVLRTMLLFLGGLFVCLLLGALTAGAPQGVFIVAAVMLASGLAGLLLSATPLLLAQENRVSSAGGLVTAVWSVAGGVSGTVVGGLVESSGWTAVFILWMVLTMTAAGAVLVASHRLHRA